MGPTAAQLQKEIEVVQAERMLKVKHEAEIDAYTKSAKREDDALKAAEKRIKDLETQLMNISDMQSKILDSN